MTLPAALLDDVEPTTDPNHPTTGDDLATDSAVATRGDTATQGDN